MLQTIKCKNCGGESLNVINVNIILSRTEWCDHCHHNNEQKQYYHFCSLKCFHNYMNKVSIKELPQLEWKSVT